MEDTVHAVSHENKKNTAHGNSGSKVYCLFKWTDVTVTITLAFLQIPQHKGCSNHKFLTHLINAVLKQSPKANMLILSIESYWKMQDMSNKRHKKLEVLCTFILDLKQKKRAWKQFITMWPAATAIIYWLNKEAGKTYFVVHKDTLILIQIPFFQFFAPKKREKKRIKPKWKLYWNACVKNCI